MTTLEFAQNETVKNCQDYASRYETSIKEIHFGSEIEIFWRKPKLEFNFPNGYVVYSDGDTKEPLGIIFTCAFKTPKGYISSKDIQVSVLDAANVTLDEATELLKYNTDAIKNTYDPWWHLNQARAANNAAWNYIASNYLQDDCR